MPTNFAYKYKYIVQRSPNLELGLGGILPKHHMVGNQIENNSVNFYSVSCHRIVKGGQFELITLIITDHVSSIIAFPSIALASNGL